MILLYDITAVGVLLVLLRRTQIPLGVGCSLVLTIALALPSLGAVAVVMTTGDWRLLPFFWLICFVPVVLSVAKMNWRAPVKPVPKVSIGVVRAVSAAAAVTAVCAAAIRTFNRPYGGWDALAIWNLKARFLFFGVDDGSWTRIFQPDASVAHPDYPLLLPATVFRLWLALGDAPQWVPAVFGVVVLALSIVLLHASVKECTNRLAADLSVLVLLSTTFFVQHAASQFADSYLALLILAASVVLRQLLYDHSRSNDGLNLLYGIILGLVAATKNEGLLVTTVFVLVYTLDLLARNNMRTKERLRALLFVCAGWLVMFYPQLLVRYTFDVTSDLISGQSLEHIATVLSWKRIASLFWLVLPVIAEFMVLPFVTAIGAWWVLRAHLRPVLDRTSGLLIAAPLLVLCGYLIVLWLTPHDMAFHVTTSLERLLVHVWGALVFALGSMFAGHPARPLRHAQG